LIIHPSAHPQNAAALWLTKDFSTKIMFQVVILLLIFLVTLGYRTNINTLKISVTFLIPKHFISNMYKNENY
jgi:hypothetical protein